MSNKLLLERIKMNAYENKTTDEILNEAHKLTNQTVSSTERSLALLNESHQIAVKSMNELSHQRETIMRTQDSVDDIKMMNKKASKHLDSINSISGTVTNILTPEFNSKSTNSKMNNKQKHKDVKTYENHNNTLTNDELDVLLPETKDNLKIIDKNTDKMSDMLDNLQEMAIIIQNEVKGQNTRLDMTNRTIDKAHDKSRQNNRKARSIVE